MKVIIFLEYENDITLYRLGMKLNFTTEDLATCQKSIATNILTRSYFSKCKRGYHFLCNQ